MKLKNELFDWLKRMFIWLKKGKLFWCYLGLIVIFLLFQSLYLYFGVILQLIGIVIIVLGINKKIRLFNNENPLKHHLGYFAQIPCWRVKDIKLNISGISTASSITDATIRTGVRKPDTNIVDVIRYIDEKTMQINQDISDIRSDFSEHIDRLSKKVDHQREQLNLSIQNIERKLIISSTSDISLELFGAGWNCYIYPDSKLS
jgi:hypothetical protein